MPAKYPTPFSLASRPSQQGRLETAASVATGLEEVGPAASGPPVPGGLRPFVN